MTCPGNDPSSIDDRVSAMFDSFGLTQLVVGPSREDNQLDVLAKIYGTLVNNAKPDDGKLISDHSLITANWLIR
jgi:hypothetical protein